LPTIDFQFSQRLNIVDRQLYDKSPLAAPPTIALDTTDQPLTVMVDLDETFLAMIAAFHVPYLAWLRPASFLL
jgi:hypothetical protein